MSHIVAKDGATILPHGGSVSVTADGIATKVVTIQLRSGADESGSPVDEVGAGEEVKVQPNGLVPVDMMSGNLDGAGKVDFTFGPFAAGTHGCVSVGFECMGISPEEGKRTGVTLDVMP